MSSIASPAATSNPINIGTDPLAEIEAQEALSSASNAAIASTPDVSRTGAVPPSAPNSTQTAFADGASQVRDGAAMCACGKSGACTCDKLDQGLDFGGGDSSVDDVKQARSREIANQTVEILQKGADQVTKGAGRCACGKEGGCTCDKLDKDLDFGGGDTATKVDDTKRLPDREPSNQVREFIKDGADQVKQSVSRCACGKEGGCTCDKLDRDLDFGGGDTNQVDNAKQSANRDTANLAREVIQRGAEQVTKSVSRCACGKEGGCTCDKLDKDLDFGGGDEAKADAKSSTKQDSIQKNDANSKADELGTRQRQTEDPRDLSRAGPDETPTRDMAAKADRAGAEGPVRGENGNQVAARDAGRATVESSSSRSAPQSGSQVPNETRSASDSLRGSFQSPTELTKSAEHGSQAASGANADARSTSSSETVAAAGRTADLAAKAADGVTTKTADGTASTKTADGVATKTADGNASAKTADGVATKTADGNASAKTADGVATKTADGTASAKTADGVATKTADGTATAKTAEGAAAKAADGAATTKTAEGADKGALGLRGETGFEAGKAAQGGTAAGSSNASATFGTKGEALLQDLTATLQQLIKADGKAGEAAEAKSGQSLAGTSVMPGGKAEALTDVERQALEQKLLTLGKELASTADAAARGLGAKELAALDGGTKGQLEMLARVLNRAEARIGSDTAAAFVAGADTAGLADGPAVLAMLAKLPAEAKQELLEVLKTWGSLAALSGAASGHDAEGEGPLRDLRGVLDSLASRGAPGAEAAGANKGDARADVRYLETAIERAVGADGASKANEASDPNSNEAARNRDKLFDASLKGWLGLAAARQAANRFTASERDGLNWLQELFAGEELDNPPAAPEEEVEEEGSGERQQHQGEADDEHRQPDPDELETPRSSPRRGAHRESRIAI